MLKYIIQSIERCENDIRDFLSKPAASSANDPDNVRPEGGKSGDIPFRSQNKPVVNDAPKVNLNIPLISAELNVIEIFPKLASFQDNAENKDIRQYMDEINRSVIFLLSSTILWF